VAEVIIRLVVDPTTGKKNVVIGYRSDADAMPIEHEDAHREIVDKLIEGGALSAAELGEIIVERDRGPDPAAKRLGAEEVQNGTLGDNETGIPAAETAAETETIGGIAPLPEKS
jgi:hypothetical protein